jgi:ABC-type multidrug transport system ATPase subunit
VDLRVLVRQLAAEGKTVLVSSHVLTELDEMADDAVFISGGRTVATQSVAGGDQPREWRLTALAPEVLTAWLDENGPAYRTESDGSGVLVELTGDAAAAALLRSAIEAGVAVSSLAPAGGVLEQAYLALEEERR